MKQEVKRNYLEINSLQDLKESKLPSEDYSLELLDPINFQLNKFFYKNIGKKYHGNKFIDDAFKFGAKYCITDKKYTESKKNENIISAK